MSFKVCYGAGRVREHQNNKEQETLFLLDLLRYSRTSFSIKKKEKH